MGEKPTKIRRYLVYILLFYCVGTTVCLLPLLRHRSRLCQKPTSPQDPHSFLPQIPSLADHDFPLKIWQTATTGVSALDPVTQSWIRSWIEQNPNHRYEMLTDGSSESYVMRNFAQKPELIHDFLILRDPVLRADLLRYLLLYGDGGIYSDVDTVCLRPFDTWIPTAFKDRVNLIIGIERDSLGGPKTSGITHDVGLGQWTLAAKPGHSMIEGVIDSVRSRLRMLAESQNSTLATLEASYEDVINTTGPGVFDDCIYRDLSLVTGTNVTSGNLTGLTEPKLIGDVLILPITAFAPGVPHSNAKGPGDKDALVQHLFAGSWKAKHPLGGVEPL